MKIKGCENDIYGWVGCENCMFKDKQEMCMRIRKKMGLKIKYREVM